MQSIQHNVGADSFRFIAEACPVALVLTQEADGRIVFANESAAKLLDVGRDDLVGRQAVEFYADPHDRGIILEALRRDGSLRDYDLRAKTAVGRELWLLLSIQRMVMDGQNVLLTGFYDVTDRKRAEAALRESEFRFRQVTGHIKEVFWMSTVDKSQILYISPGYERVWGRSCESLYAFPRSWLDAIHPEDRERVRTTAEQYQATERYDVRYRVIRPDGSERTVHDRGFPIRDEAGHVYRIAGVAVDVTDDMRRHVRRSIQYAVARILAEAGKAADVPGKLLDAIGTRLGFRTGVYWECRGSVLCFGSAWADVQLRHGDDMPGRVCHDRRALWYGAAAELLFRCRPALPGSPFRTVCALPVMADGEVLGVMEWFSSHCPPSDEDLLETLTIVGGRIGQCLARKRIEEAFLSLSHQYNLILRSAGEGIYGVDVQGTIIFANPSALAMLGWNTSELVGRNVHVFHPPGAESAPGQYPSCALCLDIFEGKARHSADDVFLRREGEPIAVEYRSTPMLDGGRVVGAVVVFSDIRARKAAEAELYRREAQLRRLIDERERMERDLHDDIIQSLYAIGLNLSAAKSSLRRKSGAAERIQNTIHQLNAVTRKIRHYIVGFKEGTVSGNEVLLIVDRLLKMMSDVSTLTFTFERDPAIGDQLTPHQAYHMLHIIREAVCNCAKHSEATKAVVSLRRDAEKILLRICDDGKGFDPSTEAASGQGLHNISARSRLLNAELHITSIKGKGTDIRLCVPISRSQEACRPSLES